MTNNMIVCHFYRISLHRIAQMSTKNKLNIPRKRERTNK